MTEFPPPSVDRLRGGGSLLQRATGAVVLLVGLLLTLRLFRLIDDNAVNLLSWDQWDFYQAFIQESGFWELFRWQHGPHRQGIAFVFTGILADLSGWNTRAESFSILAWIVLATALALALRVRLFRSFSLSDVVVPLLFLTPAQYEMFLHTPNASHSAFPLVLLMLYCHAWMFGRPALRYGAVLVLNFVAIYTGFALFIGIITLLLLGLEVGFAVGHGQHRRVRRSSACFGLAFISAGSFFAGYTFNSSLPGGFEFPYAGFWADPTLYPRFVALALANFCGVSGTGLFSSLVGVGLLGLIVVVGFHNARIAVQSIDPSGAGGFASRPSHARNQVSLVIAILILFTLMFAVNMAIGRISLGLRAAHASRYFTCLIPAFFALYLHVLTLNDALSRRLLMGVMVVEFAAALLPLRAADVERIELLRLGKARWKNVYLRRENVEAADALAGFAIYPEGKDPSRKLEYLKAHRLNLYAGLKTDG